MASVVNLHILNSGRFASSFDLGWSSDGLADVCLDVMRRHDTYFPQFWFVLSFALMMRLARMVVSGLPHHVTQRGNRRELIFFEDDDQEIHRELLGEQARKADVEVWAYCLMPNHVHLILNPRQVDGLGLAVGEAHRRYTNFINARGRWTGHLFQSRFASVAMDESHLISAVCYVSLNPVRARLVAKAEGRPWSSVRAHINGADDG
jgi:putative transposase